MWFRFPPGLNQIAIEQQHFETEVRDKEGNEFFRAPDHFAPQILNLGLGFVRAEPPEGAPPDLPQQVQQDSSPVEKLVLELEAARTENERLKGENRRLADERDSFKLELDDAKELLKEREKDSSSKKEKDK